MMDNTHAALSETQRELLDYVLTPQRYIVRPGGGPDDVSVLDLTIEGAPAGRVDKVFTRQDADTLVERGVLRYLPGVNAYMYAGHPTPTERVASMLSGSGLAEDIALVDGTLTVIDRLGYTYRVTVELAPGR